MVPEPSFAHIVAYIWIIVEFEPILELAYDWESLKIPNTSHTHMVYCVHRKNLIFSCVMLGHKNPKNSFFSMFF